MFLRLLRSSAPPLRGDSVRESDRGWKMEGDHGRRAPPATFIHPLSSYSRHTLRDRQRHGLGPGPRRQIRKGWQGRAGTCVIITDVGAGPTMNSSYFTPAVRHEVRL